MIRVVVVVLFLGFALALNAQVAMAGHTIDEHEEWEGAVLCLPGEVLNHTVDCLNLGPAQYSSRMAELGITFPLRSYRGRQPDPGLASVPFHYARVTTENAPVYGSLEDAVERNNVLQRIETGFDFVTYIDRTEVEGKNYYMIAPGVWMTANDLSRISATSSFQGLLFRETPKHGFGWVRLEAIAKRTPGYYPEDYSSIIYNRYDLVEIYAVEQVGDMKWYLVSPDLWVEGRLVGRVIPNSTPPEGVDGDRWIEVNLAEQTLAVYDQNKLVFATLIASGVPGAWTQPGLFQIYSKVEAETMQGAFTSDRSDYYYLEDVPWTMYFDQARALHGTYWHNGFGYPRSRGCVNLSPGDANWIYRWAQEGDWVYVWDPSGETPTDPDFYSSGGA